MKTEEEAKKCWCPQAVAMHAGGQCGNRDAESNEFEWPTGAHPATVKQTSCIASACMAWRWEKMAVKKPGEQTHRRAGTDQPAEGYCGLAGSPS